MALSKVAEVFQDIDVRKTIRRATGIGTAAVGAAIITPLGMNLFEQRTGLLGAGLATVGGYMAASQEQAHKFGPKNHKKDISNTVFRAAGAGIATLGVTALVYEGYNVHFGDKNSPSSEIAESSSLYRDTTELNEDNLSCSLVLDFKNIPLGAEEKVENDARSLQNATYDAVVSASANGNTRASELLSGMDKADFIDGDIGPTTETYLELWRETLGLPASIPSWDLSMCAKTEFGQ